MDIVYVIPRPQPRPCFQLLAADFDVIEAMVGPYITTTRNSSGEWTFTGAMGSSTGLVDGDWVCADSTTVGKVDINNLAAVRLQEVAGPNPSYVTENP